LTKEIKLGVPGKTKSLFTQLLFFNIFFPWSTMLIYVIVGGILLGTAQKVNKTASMILFSNHVGRNTLNQNKKNKSKRYIKNTNFNIIGYIMHSDMSNVTSYLIHNSYQVTDHFPFISILS